MDQEWEQEEENEEEIIEDREISQILQLMAKYSQLQDLHYAHGITGIYKLFFHIVYFHFCGCTKYWLLFFTLLSLGGYNLEKTRQGKGVCISLATAYNDVFMETYHLEINLKPKITIVRHDIPPFIPLKRLEEEGNFQTDLRSFLDTLSQHLNAYVGRKEQLRLVKVPL